MALNIKLIAVVIYLFMLLLLLLLLSVRAPLLWVATFRTGYKIDFNSYYIVRLSVPHASTIQSEQNKLRVRAATAASTHRSAGHSMQIALLYLAVALYAPANIQLEHVATTSGTFGH